MHAKGLMDHSATELAGTPDLELTGERIVPGKTADALFREHEERYLFAGQYVPGKEVLDVACGTGIGTHYLLRTGAARCYGIDIDPRAVQYAKAAYEGCIFLTGDATEIALPDTSIDVIVSFETLEHLDDQERFFKECWRVLKPGGTFICSTPNKRVYDWCGTNPFHVRELSPDEFAGLIGTYFERLSMFSQQEHVYALHVLRVMGGRLLDRLKVKGIVRKILLPAPAMKREFSGERGNGRRQFQLYRNTWFTQPKYLVAVAYKA